MVLSSINSIVYTKRHGLVKHCDYYFDEMKCLFKVAIDFTASNGNPNAIDSLHYINPYQPNEYTVALLSVGEVCQDYDTYVLQEGILVYLN